MHDPQTLAFDICYPWGYDGNGRLGLCWPLSRDHYILVPLWATIATITLGTGLAIAGTFAITDDNLLAAVVITGVAITTLGLIAYRAVAIPPLHKSLGGFYAESLINIWHVDPERDGSDDSCGWFQRAHHGDQKVLAEIESDFRIPWSGNVMSWFKDNGDPNLSVHAIALGMFACAACVVFRRDRRRSDRFLRYYLYDILEFAENDRDSMHVLIAQPFGKEEQHSEAERRHAAAVMVYGWILRTLRPWWRHPRWHIHHWRIQVIPLGTLRRRLLTRCQVCGKRFKWGEVPVGSWDDPPPRWFEFLRGERGLAHHDCHSRTAYALPDPPHLPDSPAEIPPD